jgi:hypothetical protein
MREVVRYDDQDDGVTNGRENPKTS